MKTTYVMMAAFMATTVLAPAAMAQVGGTVGAGGGVTTGTGIGGTVGTRTGITTGTGGGVKMGTSVNADVPRDSLNVGTGLNANGRANASGYSSIRNSENVRANVGATGTGEVRRESLTTGGGAGIGAGISR